MFWVILITVLFFGSHVFFEYILRLDVETEATLKRAAKIRQRTNRKRMRQESKK